jgi:hypothetical protein
VLALLAEVTSVETIRYCEASNEHRKKATVMTTAVAPSPLTASDRCDRCGAQAYLRVNLASGGELLFCAHHAREHGEKLRTIAVNVHDETGRLLEPPKVAAED